MTHPTAAVGELTEILSGFAFKSEQFNSSGEGLPLIRIRDVVDGASDTYYTGDYKPEYLIKNGDALIGMDGQFNLACWRGGPALLNQRVCKIKATDERLDQDYLLRFLPAVLKEIEDRTPFVTVKHLSVKSLREIEIPLPPLPEQRRIAAILDKADALRAKRREAIVKLDQLLQSVFLEMFGDPVSNPKGWEVVEIKELLLEHRPGANISPEDFTAEGFPVLHKGAIRRFGELEVDEGKKTFVSPKYAEAKTKSIVGDEFVAVTLRDLVPSGPTIGLAVNIARSDQPEYLLVQGAYGLRLNPERVLNDYFVWLSNTSDFKAQIKRVTVGSTQIHCRFPLYAAIRIAVPELALQEKFKNILTQVLHLKKNLASASELDKCLWNSLQKKAFSGAL